MVLATREALSRIEASKPVTREDVLRMIPQFFIRPIFLRARLDRKVALAIGVLGERGGGKSTTCTVISVVDFMLAGRPVYSNIEIKCDIQISDETARNFGLNRGGIASYKSLPLEKDPLLNLDERYRKCGICIEEINIQYANVRRPMANTNIDFNQVCQQLRKFNSHLLYNVIDEMFIDPQLRVLTDIFIRTYDTAFDTQSLDSGKDTGLDFHWRIYPMSSYLCGHQGRYAVTKKALDPVYLKFGPWRGIFDSTAHQEKGIYTKSTKEREREIRLGIDRTNVSAESSPEMIAELDEWGWLAEKAMLLKKQGIKFIKPWDLWEFLKVPATQDIKEHLPMWGIRWDNTSQSYRISDYDLSRARQSINV